MPQSPVAASSPIYLDYQASTPCDPRVIEAYRSERDAPELFPLMGQTGLLGATIPEEYGGVGASYVAYGLIARA